LEWEFDFDSAIATPDTISGGIAFRFGLADLKSQFGGPGLLPDNDGWSLGSRRAQVEMRFEPLAAIVHFERGQNLKSERCSTTLRVRKERNTLLRRCPSPVNRTGPQHQLVADEMVGAV
jgi:hypothetical protein